MGQLIGEFKDLVGVLVCILKDCLTSHHHRHKAKGD